MEFSLAAPDRRHPEKDQFFVLGDNSAQSKDGRLWEPRRSIWVSAQAVDRQGAVHLLAALVGRATVYGDPLPVLPEFREDAPGAVRLELRGAAAIPVMNDQ